MIFSNGLIRESDVQTVPSKNCEYILKYLIRL